MERALIEERIKSLMETKGSAKGYLYAKLSNGLIYESNNLDFGSQANAYIFLSTNGDGYFTHMNFPRPVVGDAPHRLDLPNNTNRWMIARGDDYYSLFPGVAHYTLSDDENSMYGHFELTLKEGLTMDGGFYVTNT